VPGFLSGGVDVCAGPVCQAGDRMLTGMRVTSQAGVVMVHSVTNFDCHAIFYRHNKAFPGYLIALLRSQ
jgi:hypothetical protein